MSRTSIRRKAVLLLLGAVLPLLWAGGVWSRTAAAEGGGLPGLTRVLLELVTPSQEPTEPRASMAAAAGSQVQQEGAGGVLNVSIGPILSAFLSFASQPARASHGFAFALPPGVAVQGVQDLPVTLAIKPGTGAPAATLTCSSDQDPATTGPQLTPVAGVASFPGCQIDLPGQGYVLAATATGAQPVESAAFDVVWTGDANGDCQVDIVDFSVLVREFGSLGPARRADFDGNGVVDIVDFSLLVALFSTRCPTLQLAAGSGPAGSFVTATGERYVPFREGRVGGWRGSR